MQHGVLNKDADEAMDYFELISENAQSWDTSDLHDRTRTPQPTVAGKFYNEDLHAKVSQLTRKLESMDMKKVHEVETKPKVEEHFTICDINDHSTHQCPTIRSYNEWAAVNAISQNHSYLNQGWKNPSNNAWKGESSNQNAPPQPPHGGFHNNFQSGYSQGQGQYQSHQPQQNFQGHPLKISKGMDTKTALGMHFKGISMLLLN